MKLVAGRADLNHRPLGYEFTVQRRVIAPDSDWACFSKGTSLSGTLSLMNSDGNGIAWECLDRRLHLLQGVCLVAILWALPRLPNRSDSARPACLSAQMKIGEAPLLPSSKTRIEHCLRH
jgi:hypothetical protein